MTSQSPRSLSLDPGDSLAPGPERSAAPPAAGGKSLFDLLPRWELLAAGLLTLLALYPHIHLYLQHQPLWRDEVNLLQMATLPTFADTWKYLPYDSCPALFHGIVRVWTGVFPPDQDFHLRLLGLIIGVAGLAAMWLGVRTMGGRAPLLSIALLGSNPLFIRYDDSVRAYGLGILFALLTLVAVWRLVEKVSAGRVVLAVAVGVLSVHALFYNAVLLLAVCVSGALVAAWERDWKKAAVILAIGLPAALSLLPYGAMIHEQHRWGFLLYYPVTAAWIWKRLSEVTGSPDPIGVWVWTLLVLGLAGWAGSRLFRRRASGAPLETRDRAMLFALLSLVTGLVSYGVFLKVLNYYTQPWYYITILALAAVCLDVICGGLIDRATAGARPWRLVRLALAFGFASLTFLQARQELLARPTNVDLVAKTLSDDASKDDLIVHLRWECAIPFGHYYHGGTPQETTPPLADHRFHRYDLVLQAMATPDATAPVLTRMADALRAGHKVWLVGEPIFLTPGAAVPPLRPAVQGPDGRWQMGGDYYTVWQMQVCRFLQDHVTSARKVDVPVDQHVLFYEDLPLSVFQGWKASDAPSARPEIRTP